MIVVPSRIQPLHSPYRNSDRASRCLRLPVGWVDSSLKYRWMFGTAGIASGIRWVSDERLKSASILAMAEWIQCVMVRRFLNSKQLNTAF